MRTLFQVDVPETTDRDVGRQLALSLSGGEGPVELIFAGGAETKTMGFVAPVDYPGLTEWPAGLYRLQVEVVQTDSQLSYRIGLCEYSKLGNFLVNMVLDLIPRTGTGLQLLEHTQLGPYATISAESRFGVILFVERVPGRPQIVFGLRVGAVEHFADTQFAPGPVGSLWVPAGQADEPSRWIDAAPVAGIWAAISAPSGTWTKAAGLASAWATSASAPASAWAAIAAAQASGFVKLANASGDWTKRTVPNALFSKLPAAEGDWTKRAAPRSAWTPAAQAAATWTKLPEVS